MTTPRLALAEDDPSLGQVLEERRWAFDALSNLGDGILIVDDRARLVYSNPAAGRIFDSKTLSALPGTWSEARGMYRSDERTLYPEDELPLVQALAGTVVEDVELYVRNPAVPDGIHLLCNACPLRDASGGVRGATVLFHDITLRRLQQVQLLEGERQKRAILDNIPYIAWLKDREGRFIAVNLPFAQAAGRADSDAVLGKTDFDLWPHDLATRYRTDDDEIMATGIHKRLEEPLVDGQGMVRWIETFKTRITSDNGEIIGTTGIARDITERRRAEEALRIANDQLERRVALRNRELAEVQGNLVRKERLAVLGQLAGGVAHQIRNPLAAIMNATYVLKRHIAPSPHPNVEDALRIIHDEVRHANVIITGLLDYARVRTPDRHPTALDELVERVLAADGIPDDVEVECAIEPVPMLEVDAEQIHGAIFNLVRNAIEAMPGGGTLRVAMRPEGDQVVISVSDTGQGISPQVRGHLFEPLHSSKPMGVGLGLVTARTFIEAHGGRIEHVDVPSGARFEIRLPLPAP